MSFQRRYRGGLDRHRLTPHPSLMDGTGGDGHHASRYGMEEHTGWSQAHSRLGTNQHLPPQYMYHSMPLYGIHMPGLLPPSQYMYHPYHPTTMYGFPVYGHDLQQSSYSMHARTHHASRYYQSQRILDRPHLTTAANHRTLVTRHSCHQSSRPTRPMIALSEPAMDSNGQTFPKLSVMTYNILAQDLIEKNPSLYTHAQPEHLEWTYRREKIKQELVQSKADVICLQEVEEEHYQTFFIPQLHSLGYDSLYQKRTGSHVDGCAVFYQTKLLHLVASVGVNYQRHTGALNRDNVGLIARLRFVNGSDRKTEFCIATTHLLFNPKAGEVKLAQLALLLAELHTLASDEEKLLPCILLGDFNCVPKAPLLDFILKGRLDYCNVSAHAIAGYVRHSDSHRRTIPFPLLPESLCIGQDCIYHKRDAVSDTKEMSETQPVTEAVMEDATDPSNATDHPATTTPVDMIDLTLNNNEDHKEQAAVQNTTDKKEGKKSADGDLERVKTLTASVEEAVHSQLKNETPQQSSQIAASSTSTSHMQMYVADPEGHCSSSPLPSSRKHPNPEASAVLTHPFSFTSAYPLPPNRSTSHSITTYHSHACEMVDYMFYTPAQGKGWSHSHGFYLTGRKALPSTHSLLNLGPQPHRLLSSDHLYLLAEYQLLEDQK